MSARYLQILIIAFVILFSIRLWQASHNISKYVDGQEISVITTLSSPPKIQGSSQKITVYLDGNQAVFITLPRYPEFEYGQTVRISGPVTLKELHGASTLKGSVLPSGNAVMTMYFPKVEAVKNPKQNVFTNMYIFTASVRAHIASVFSRTLPSDLASLLSGIVMGGNSEFSAQFKQALQKAGVMHVVAASGMNVVLIAGFLASVFSFVFRRQVAFACTIVGIILYAILAGLEPPIVRAAIMGSLIFIAHIIGRQYMGAYGLVLASFTMLFISPDLLYDVGFGLSVSATAGLLYLKPILDRFVSIPVVTDDFTTTLAAQIATLPILLSTFGSYSPVSIVVNVLVLWTTPILMVLGGAAAVFSFIFEPLASIFLYLSLPFLLYFEYIIYSMSGLTEMQSPTIPFLSIVGYYTFLLSLILLKKPQK